LLAGIHLHERHAAFLVLEERLHPFEGEHLIRINGLPRKEEEV